MKGNEKLGADSSELQVGGEQRATHSSSELIPSEQDVCTRGSSRSPHHHQGSARHSLWGSKESAWKLFKPK